MRKILPFLLIIALTILTGQALLAQDDDPVMLDREAFPPVQIANSSSGCLVTVEGTGLPFAGFSVLDPFQRTISQVGGTGLIVHPDGYIITDPDVVRDSEWLKVTHEGVEYDATVELVDEFYDIALIRIDATGLPAVVWADSDQVLRGEPVVVMGAPAGLESTLTYGFVTNIRDFRIPGPTGYDGMLIISGFVVDAALHTGVQTGPVFNSDGEAIAIVSRKSRGGEENIGYCIPSNIMEDVVHQMIYDGEVCHPWLGIFPFPYYDRSLALYMGIPVDEIDPETGEEYDVVGILVDRIAAGSPASQNGILRGDLILRADGMLLRTVKDLEALITNKGCDGEVDLVILRNGELKYNTVQISTKLSDYENIYSSGYGISI